MLLTELFIHALSDYIYICIVQVLNLGKKLIFNLFTWSDIVPTTSIS